MLLGNSPRSLAPIGISALGHSGDLICSLFHFYTCFLNEPHKFGDLLTALLGFENYKLNYYLSNIK